MGTGAQWWKVGLGGGGREWDGMHSKIQALRCMISLFTICAPPATKKQNKNN